MIKKKNNFLTFIFSCFPGAGHMYMGFMKEGLSLMSLFFAIIAFTGLSGLVSISLLLPILWFYSFFDSINKMSLCNEDFYKLNDHFLFSLDHFLVSKEKLFSKYKLVIAFSFIFIGAAILWDNTISLIPWHLIINSEKYSFILEITHQIPQSIIGFIIIAIGIRLIINKKSSLKEENENINFIETSTSNESEEN